MTALAGERGMTLPEVLVAATLLIVILGATLTTFTQFNSTTRVNQLQNDAQQEARVAVDAAARAIRNAGTSTRVNPENIELAEPYQLVYQDVEPSGVALAPNERNIRRVRYCLSPETTGPAVLWRQVQTFAAANRPPRPSTASCPDSAWPQREGIARNVVNRIDGQARPVFVYDGTPTTLSSRLRIQLWIDVNPGKKPRESRLDTAVILRNFNQSPSAAFTWTPNGTGSVYLNASDSSDLDGDRLTYQWFVEGVSGAVDDGVLIQYPIAVGQERDVTLKVSDPAGYESSVTQEVDR